MKSRTSPQQRKWNFQLENRGHVVEGDARGRKSWRDMQLGLSTICFTIRKEIDQYACNSIRDLGRPFRVRHSTSTLPGRHPSAGPRGRQGTASGFTVWKRKASSALTASISTRATSAVRLPRDTGSPNELCAISGSPNALRKTLKPFLLCSVARNDL